MCQEAPPVVRREVPLKARRQSGVGLDGGFWAASEHEVCEGVAEVASVGSGVVGPDPRGRKATWVLLDT